MAAVNNEFLYLFTGKNIVRLLEGLLTTLEISLLSVILSIIFGIIFGIILTSKNPVVYLLSRFYLEFMRIIPQLVILFVFYFGFSNLLSLDAFSCSIIVFTLWGLAEFGDLVRGQIDSIPKGQIEAGKSVGLKHYQIIRYILIPQSIPYLIPPAINLITRMIKTTAIVPLIGVIDVLKVGQQIMDFSRMQAPNGPLWIYGEVLVIYFVICWPISLWGTYLENKLKGVK